MMRCVAPLLLLGLLVGCGYAWGDSSTNAPMAAVAAAAPRTTTPTTIAALALPQSVPRTKPLAANSAVTAQIIDSYDASTNVLTVPLVRVGTRFYQDVRLTVGSVVSSGQASGTSGIFDTYDAATNQLTVPVVRVGDDLYRNLVVGVGSLLSYGGSVDSISVSTDIGSRTYPQSWQTATTNEADFNPNPCNLELEKVTYPSHWNGKYPLPPVTGAPLKPAIQRSVTLKDIGLQPGNPAFIEVFAPGAPSGCTGDLQTELGKTVKRLKAIGSDYVNITQWHWAAPNPDGSWYITSAESTFGVITDADLAGFVQKAHGAGLKVIMRNQIQGFAQGIGGAQTVSVPPNNAESWAKWFPAYQAYIAERAKFFQSIGVDVWEVGCNACLFRDDGDGSPAAATLFRDQYETALNTMKLHFAGKTLFLYTPWLNTYPAFAARIDMFDLGFYGPSPFPDSLNQNLTAAAYRAAVEASYLQTAVNQLDPFGKTIMISYGVQSRRNVFTFPGYLEETACTASQFDFDKPGVACLQREQVTDFSMQAILHEGTLGAINQLSAPKSTLMVNVLDYWITDSLMPFTAFPNLGYSIRNKPAEGIVKAWFTR